MVDHRDAPPAMLKLLGWLEATGLQQSEEQVRDRFNQMAIFDDEHTRVRVVVDRGDWSVGVGITAFDSTFHPDVWEAYLNGLDRANDSSLEHQVDFLVTRWADARRAAMADADAEGTLRAIDREFVRRLLGWDPGPG